MSKCEKFDTLRIGDAANSGERTMFYGTDNFEYYPNTNEAVLVVFKKGSRRALILGYSWPKAKVKINITVMELEEHFIAKNWPTPTHRISGISRKVLRKSFQGSKKHQRILGKRARDEFFSEILQVLTCRQDYGLLQDHTLQ